MVLKDPSSKEDLWKTFFIKKYTYNKEMDKLGRATSKKLNSKKTWSHAKKMAFLIFRDYKGNLSNAMDLDYDDFSNKYNEENLKE